MSTSYFLTMHTPAGVPFTTVVPISLEYARSEMQVGAATVIMDGSLISYADLQRDTVLTIHRLVDDREPYLAGNTIWFLRKKHLEVYGKGQILTLGFEDPLTILNRRIIAYYADVSQTDKEAAADNIMRAIVRENLGSLATDATRQVLNYFQIEEDATYAPSITWSQSWSNMLTELRNLAQTSFNLGTYLSFNVDTLIPPSTSNFFPFLLNFTVRKSMLGNDHTVTSGISPVLVGPEYGNMSDIAIEDDWTTEANHLYVGGEGDDSDRLLVEVSNAAAQGAGPLTRYEEFVDHSDVYVSTDLTNAGNADLANKITRTKISGNLRDSESVKYGINVGYGDYVTAQVLGYSVDVHLNTEHVTWDAENGEELDIRMEGALPA